MDKRYQVFVSSTYEDLKEERQEVMHALLELDCIPSGMELFPAADTDQWTLIKKLIDDCDYYVVILGGRYGSIGPDGISYTQMEYEYAVQRGKPVIGFYHQEPGKLTADNTEKTATGKKKLKAFRSLIQQKLCKPWHSASDLGGKVVRSMNHLIRTTPAVGWIRADRASDDDAAKEMLRLRQQIEDLQTRLSDANASTGKDTDQYEQGDDRITLRYSFVARDNMLIDTPYEAKFSPTWNEIFRHISPFMVNEAAEATLKNNLDAFVRDENIEDLSKHKQLKGFELSKFALSIDDFQTIKIQLLALKLVQRSDPKKARGVNDRSTYWTLTSRGETEMMTLRAIKRNTINANQMAEPTTQTATLANEVQGA